MIELFNNFWGGVVVGLFLNAIVMVIIVTVLDIRQRRRIVPMSNDQLTGAPKSTCMITNCTKQKVPNTVYCVDHLYQLASERGLPSRNIDKLIARNPPRQ